MQQMLPSIRSIVGDTYVLKKGSAPVHRAHQTVELLQQETPIAPDLWPPNSPALNPEGYQICGVMQDCVSNASSRRDPSEAALD